MPPENNQNNNPQYPPVYPQQPAQSQYPAQPPQPVYPSATPAPAYPAPAQPQQEGSPYDFFLDPKDSKQRSLVPKKGLSLPKILMLAGAVFAALIIAAVVLSAGSKKPESSASLTSAVKNQQEIIRVSGLGQKTIESANLKNFAATAEATTISSQQELITYILQHGGKIDTKALATATDPRNDRTLAAAESSSTYDSTFRSLMHQLLTDYEVKLQQISDNSTLQSERTIVDKNITSAQLLEKMLGQQ